MAYAVQIANPLVVQKIERLAQTMKLGKTAVIDRALDVLAEQHQNDGIAIQTMPKAEPLTPQQKFLNILAEIHKIPDLPNPIDPFNWDEHGLPT
jgi:antitoxin VapB